MVGAVRVGVVWEFGVLFEQGAAWELCGIYVRDTFQQGAVWDLCGRYISQGAVWVLEVICAD